LFKLDDLKTHSFRIPIDALKC